MLSFLSGLKPQQDAGTFLCGAFWRPLLLPLFFSGYGRCSPESCSPACLLPHYAFGFGSQFHSAFWLILPEESLLKAMNGVNSYTGDIRPYVFLGKATVTGGGCAIRIYRSATPQGLSTFAVGIERSSVLPLAIKPVSPADGIFRMLSAFEVDS